MARSAAAWKTALSLLISLHGAAHPASALTIELVPSVSVIEPGAVVAVDVEIAGLGAFEPPSVAGLDLDLAFDASVLSAIGVTWSASLGSTSLGEVVSGFAPGTGTVDFFVLSLLPATALDAIQPASFVLATVSFRALSVGVTSLVPTLRSLVDGAGDPLAASLVATQIRVVPIPEPTSVILLLAGLALLATLHRRHAARIASAASLTIGLAGCSVPPPSASSPPAYDLIDLGAGFVPSDVNEREQVVGHIRIAGQSHAALWEKGQIHDLGLLGADETQALRITDVGVVHGFASPPLGSGGDDRLFRWEETTGTMQDLGSLPFHPLLPIADIDAQGRAVGTRENPFVDLGVVYFQGTPLHYYSVGSVFWNAFVATGSGVTGLPSLEEVDVVLGENCVPQLPEGAICNPITTTWPAGALAYAVNGAGQVVGEAFSGLTPELKNPEFHAVRWSGGNIEDLGIPSGGLSSSARAINEAGHVAGSWVHHSTGGTGALRCFLWPGTGPLIDLGTLGLDYCLPTSLNDRGQLVGVGTTTNQQRPFLWDNGVMSNLDALMPANTPWSLGYAYAINDRGAIVGTGVLGGVPHGFLLRPSPRPVVLIPGIVGTYPEDPALDLVWLENRGVPPALLQLDPLARVYHDTVKTLENVGYVQGKDLFVVKYDWRLPPAPNDGVIDGQISGITAASISDGVREHAVDYLGEVLREAAEQWKIDHPGTTLDTVDVISHSTGGLVARSYVQSGAYGGTYTGSDALPKFENLILVGVPGRGASKAWNPLHDNWVTDPAFQMVLSKVVSRAFTRVMKGSVIHGPDYEISLASLHADGCATTLERCFIERYVPTVRSLLATYPFLLAPNGLLEHVNSDPLRRNFLALDLNAGLDLALVGDPNAFTTQAKVTVIHGTNGGLSPAWQQFALGIQTGTPYWVEPKIGPDSLFGLTADVIARMSDANAHDAAPGEHWFRDQTVPNFGDGTVPTDSSAEQFANQANVEVRAFTQSVGSTLGNTLHSVGHTDLMWNPDVQGAILDTLGVVWAPDELSTTLHGENAGAIACAVSGCWNLILDPVEGFLVDAQGRRLGYSTATGPLAEIPRSVWYGQSDGIGWISGAVEGPLALQLAGLGGSYAVSVSGLGRAGRSGLIDAGALAPGASRTLVVPRSTAPAAGNLDADDDVDLDDLAIVLAARNQPAQNPPDDRDLNADGVIDLADARRLVTHCTRTNCVTE